MWRLLSASSPSSATRRLWSLVAAAFVLALFSAAGAAIALAVDRAHTSANSAPAHAYDLAAGAPITTTTTVFFLPTASLRARRPLRPASLALVAASARSPALAGFVAAEEVEGGVHLIRPYARPSGGTTPAQRAAVQGRPCVDCGAIADVQVADHIDPLMLEYYRTGSIDLEFMRDVEAVQPQCPTCSARQGATLSQASREIRAILLDTRK